MTNVAEQAIRHVWTEGDLSRIPEFYAENFVGHVSTPGLNWTGVRPDFEWKGHEGVRELVTAVRATFPDYSETPQVVVASGDFIAMRMINRGTHSGQAIGEALPSGASFEVVDTMFVRLEDGLIAEQWALIDEYALGVQLGLVSGHTLPRSDEAPETLGVPGVPGAIDAPDAPK